MNDLLRRLDGDSLSQAQWLPLTLDLNFPVKPISKTATAAT